MDEVPFAEVGRIGCVLSIFFLSRSTPLTSSSNASRDWDLIPAVGTDLIRLASFLASIRCRKRRIDRDYDLRARCVLLIGRLVINVSVLRSFAHSSSLPLSRTRASFFYPLCPIVIYSLPFCRVPLPRSDYFSSSSSLVHPRKTAMALGSLVTVPYRSGSCKALALLPRAIEEAILCRYLRDGEYARARYLSCRIHSRMAEGREERGEGGGGRWWYTIRVVRHNAAIRFRGELEVHRCCSLRSCRVGIARIAGTIEIYRAI